ncbi:suppressor of cytokine signaling 2-like isoform X2 [Pectinophora gossypiella]|uniref:suppressor of cytokine signaling 2-like isoform X2 n=1 Tax=Pectinophora gossypiella TaxID=13191 RepID=UPI00214E8510|nr:suppressor of cytokine signaling 2-like isoform X2 [Pectinophora gossypiella]
MVVKLPDSCVAVGVPLSTWSADVACPNCRHELRVTVAPGGKVASVPHWCLPISPWCGPITPQCTAQPTYLSQYAPLSPVLPPQCNDELRRLADTLRVLRLSGWYYGNLDWQGARNLLKEARVGEFVIRDSGDRNFIFSLSVQTERGPTSVRLHYEQGYFRLDCDRPLARYMPRFRCVIELVLHYMRLGCRGAAGTVWVDKEGCPHSPVLLRSPLRKDPPSLKHSARLAIHKALDSNPLTPKIQCAPKHRHLPLPSILIDYLGEYPYSI